jgi:copper oxidase (laccase) domain-containing protein
VKKIAGKTVKAMVEKCGCKASGIIAGIGPSIGPCCYEVGQEVFKKASDSFGKQAEQFFNFGDDGKGHFDLWAANKAILLDSGILEKNLEIAELCTKCNSEYFYSYRGQDGKCGRIAAGIMLI